MAQLVESGKGNRTEGRKWGAGGRKNDYMEEARGMDREKHHYKVRRVEERDEGMKMQRVRIGFD